MVKSTISIANFNSYMLVYHEGNMVKYGGNMAFINDTYISGSGKSYIYIYIYVYIYMYSNRMCWLFI
jgi:hypothetical protein